MTPAGETLYNVPYIDDAQLAQMAAFWKKQTRRGLFRRR